MAGRSARRECEEVLLRLLSDGLDRAGIVGARHVEIGQQHQRRLAGLGDGSEIRLRIVGAGGQDGLAQHEQARIEEQRIAVGIGTPHGVGAHGARSAADVLDHDRLAELLGQELRRDAPEPVRPAAGRVRHDHLQRLVGIGTLREGWRREKGGAGRAEDSSSPDHGCTETAEAQDAPPGASQTVRRTRRDLMSPQAAPRAVEVSRCCFKTAVPPAAMG